MTMAETKADVLAVLDPVVEARPTAQNSRRARYDGFLVWLKGQTPIDAQDERWLWQGFREGWKAYGTSAGWRRGMATEAAVGADLKATADSAFAYSELGQKAKQDSDIARRKYDRLKYGFIMGYWQAYREGTRGFQGKAEASITEGKPTSVAYTDFAHEADDPKDMLNFWIWQWSSSNGLEARRGSGFTHATAFLLGGGFGVDWLVCGRFDPRTDSLSIAQHPDLGNRRLPEAMLDDLERQFHPKKVFFYPVEGRAMEYAGIHDLKAEELGESVLDITRDTLDTQVFETGSKRPDLLPDVAKFIEGIASLFEQEFGAKIVGKVLIGSILSYQWSPSCDIDLNLVFPSNTDEGTLDAMRKKCTEMTDKVLLPGTAHPVNPYIHTEDSLDIEGPDGVYEVPGGWVKGPYSLTASTQDYLSTFNDYLSSIDLTRGELRRDIIDYAELASLPRAELVNLEPIVRVKAKEIDRGVKALVGSYKVALKVRQRVMRGELSIEDLERYRSKNLLPANILYKLLERYHYSRLLRKLKAVLGQHGSIAEPDAVADVRTAMESRQLNGPLNDVLKPLHTSILSIEDEVEQALIEPIKIKTKVNSTSETKRDTKSLAEAHDVLYTSIGHNWGEKPEFMWAFTDQGLEVVKAGATKKMGKGDSAFIAGHTHMTEWGTKDFWNGRYDPGTGELSIVPPSERGTGWAGAHVPSVVIDALEQRFHPKKSYLFWSGQAIPIHEGGSLKDEIDLLLNEDVASRTPYLLKKYPGFHDVFKEWLRETYYGNNAGEAMKSPEVALQVLADMADPTEDRGVYLEWLVRVILKEAKARTNTFSSSGYRGVFRAWCTTALRILTEFDRLKQLKKFKEEQETDIMQYDSFAGVDDAIKPYEGLMSARQQKEMMKRTNTKLLAELNGNYLYQLTHPDACVSVLAGTSVCVNDPNTAGHYLDDGPLYVVTDGFIDLSDRDDWSVLAVVHPARGEATDAEDSPIEPDELVSDYGDLFNKAEIDVSQMGDPEARANDAWEDVQTYEDVIDFMHEWEEAVPGFWDSFGDAIEEFVASRPEWALQWARDLGEGRFEHGEETLSLYPKYAYQYAVEVMRARFRLGELAIATDPKLAVSYATKLGLDKFEEAEDAIAREGYYSYMYAVYVLHDRFQDGEAAIKKAGYWERYKTAMSRFGKDIDKPATTKGKGKKYRSVAGLPQPADASGPAGKLQKQFYFIPRRYSAYDMGQHGEVVDSRGTLAVMVNGYPTIPYDGMEIRVIRGYTPVSPGSVRYGGGRDEDRIWKSERIWKSYIYDATTKKFSNKYTGKTTLDWAWVEATWPKESRRPDSIIKIANTSGNLKDLTVWKDDDPVETETEAVAKQGLSLAAPTDYMQRTGVSRADVYEAVSEVFQSTGQSAPPVPPLVLVVSGDEIVGALVVLENFSGANIYEAHMAIYEDYRGETRLFLELMNIAAESFKQSRRRNPRLLFSAFVVPTMAKLLARRYGMVPKDTIRYSGRSLVRMEYPANKPIESLAESLVEDLLAENLETRIPILLKKYPKFLAAFEMLWKGVLVPSYYKKTEDERADFAVRQLNRFFDPTADRAIYTEWIMRMFLSGDATIDRWGLGTAHGQGSVMNVLGLFDQVKRLRKFKEDHKETGFADINRIQGIDQLREIAYPYSGMLSARAAAKKKRNLGFELIGGNEKLGWVYGIITAEAARMVCKLTNWCVRGTDYSESYIEGGPLVVVVDARIVYDPETDSINTEAFNGVYLIHPATGEAKNADNELPDEDQKDDLMALKDTIDDDKQEKYGLDEMDIDSLDTQEPDPEGEMIEEWNGWDGSPVEFLTTFSDDDGWDAVENAVLDSIASDPYYAIEYAIDVLGSEFADGEHAIASQPETALQYARHFGIRFEDAEDTLGEDPESWKAYLDHLEAIKDWDAIGELDPGRMEPKEDERWFGKGKGTDYTLPMAGKVANPKVGTKALAWWAEDEIYVEVIWDGEEWKTEDGEDVFDPEFGWEDTEEQKPRPDPKKGEVTWSGNMVWRWSGEKWQRMEPVSYYKDRYNVDFPTRPHDSQNFETPDKVSWLFHGQYKKWVPSDSSLPFHGYDRSSGSRIMSMARFTDDWQEFFNSVPKTSHESLNAGLQYPVYSQAEKVEFLESLPGVVKDGWKYARVDEDYIYVIEMQVMGHYYERITWSILAQLNNGVWVKAQRQRSDLFPPGVEFESRVEDEIHVLLQDAKVTPEFRSIPDWSNAASDACATWIWEDGSVETGPDHGTLVISRYSKQYPTNISEPDYYELAVKEGLNKGAIRAWRNGRFFSAELTTPSPQALASLLKILEGGKDDITYELSMEGSHHLGSREKAVEIIRRLLNPQQSGVDVVGDVRARVFGI